MVNCIKKMMESSGGDRGGVVVICVVYLIGKLYSEVNV